MTTTRWIRLGAVVAMTLLTVRPGTGAAQDRIQIAVVATTDVHGRAMHWDYIRDAEGPWGLTRAAAVVDSLRRAMDGRVILVDAGDMLQGTPAAIFYATAQAPVHPFIDAMNTMRYDAVTIGDHDFNYGVDFLNRAIGGATFPVLAGNVFTADAGTPAYEDDAVFERGGVRIGVAGFTNPGAMVWDRANLRGRLSVRPIIPEAERVMAGMEASGVELKIAVVHSGFRGASSYRADGVGEEHVALQMSDLASKPDLVIVGHSHRSVAYYERNGVHFIQPRPFAQSLGVAFVTLQRDGTGAYQVVSVRGEQLQVGQATPDPVLTRRMARMHDEARAWAAEPVAQTRELWSTELARIADVPAADFINRVQQIHTRAHLSATPIFDTSLRIRGEVQRRHMLGLYPDEGRLNVVVIDGATLQQYLEHSARYFKQYEGGSDLIDGSVAGADFDIVSGVNYVIDITRPPGSRVQQLSRAGALVVPTDTFTLAISSSRLAGAGGYTMLRSLPVIYDRQERIRDILIAHAAERGVLDSASYFEASWRLSPTSVIAARQRAAGSPTASRSGGSDRLVTRLIATGGFEGWLEPHLDDGREMGGIVAVHRTLDSIQRACQCEAIRVGTGDDLSGQTAADMLHGRPVLDALNAMSLDVSTLGGRDFAWGTDTLVARAGAAHHSIVATNVWLTDRRARPDWVHEWLKIQRGQYAIAVLGVMGPESAAALMPGKRAGLSFSDPVESLSQTLRTVANSGVDFTVVVADADAECALGVCSGELVDIANGLASGGVDLLVGRISGENTAEVNGITLVNAGHRGSHVGVADFIARGDGSLTVRAGAVPVWADSSRGSDELRDLIRNADRQVASVREREIARLRRPMNPAAEGEFALGALVADAFRNAARTQLAFVANRSIEGSLPGGIVSYGDITNLMPLSRNVVTITLTGRQIEALVEQFVEEGTPMVQISGMTVEYDPDRDPGRRVRRIRLENGRGLDDNDPYTIAVSDAFFGPRTGFRIAPETRFEGTGMSGADAIATYLPRLAQPVVPPPTGRYDIR